MRIYIPGIVVVFVSLSNLCQSTTSFSDGISITEKKDSVKFIIC